MYGAISGDKSNVSIEKKMFKTRRLHEELFFVERFKLVPSLAPIICPDVTATLKQHYNDWFVTR